MGSMDGTGLTAVQISLLRASRVALAIRYGLNFAFYSTGKVRKTGLGLLHCPLTSSSRPLPAVGVLRKGTQ